MSKRKVDMAQFEIKATKGKKVVVKVLEAIRETGFVDFSYKLQFDFKDEKIITFICVNGYVERYTIDVSAAKDEFLLFANLVEEIKYLTSSKVEPQEAEYDPMTDL